MPVNKYIVCLSNSDRNKLIKLVKKGESTARSILHANVLLAADISTGHKKSERDIAGLFHVTTQTVHNIRRTYAQKGLSAALGRKKRETPPISPKITGDIEARIIAISCSEPPSGRAKWTVRLIADKAVELQIIDSISYESVHRLLKKTSSNRT